MNMYEVVLDDRYYLGDLVEGIALEESLDEISQRAEISLGITPDWPGIRPGQSIYVSGTLPGEQAGMGYLLYPGVVWSFDLAYNRSNRIDLTVYDRTIYLAKSEDEYLFPAGQTATQRLKAYASDWGIELGNIVDTQTSLGKAVYRAQSIYNCLWADLCETVKAGGDMYRPRMTPTGLELYRLGSNETVWMLEPGSNVIDMNRKQTLEGTITQVKILGTETKAAEIDTSGMELEEIARRYAIDGDSKQELPSPVLAVEKGETEQLGTLQAVLQDEKLKSLGEARKAARAMLSGIQDTITVNAVDINAIRAGDKVDLVGSDMDLLVLSVRHDLGDPGRMSLTLASPDYVRRRFYLNHGR